MWFAWDVCSPAGSWPRNSLGRSSLLHTYSSAVGLRDRETYRSVSVFCMKLWCSSWWVFRWYSWSVGPQQHRLWKVATIKLGNNRPGIEEIRYLGLDPTGASGQRLKDVMLALQWPRHMWSPFRRDQWNPDWWIAVWSARWELTTGANSLLSPPMIFDDNWLLVPPRWIMIRKTLLWCVSDIWVYWDSHCVLRLTAFQFLHIFAIY